MIFYDESEHEEFYAKQCARLIQLFLYYMDRAYFKPNYKVNLLGDNDITENGLNEMEAVLKRAEVGRMALSEDSKPYVIPLNFLYWDGQIVFHCAWTGRKLDIIAKNPYCCFEVDEFMGEIGYHYDTLCHLDYDSVLVFGKARIVNDEEAKLQFFEKLHAKYKEMYRKSITNGGIRFDKTRLHEACCVVIAIEEMTGRRERTVDGKRRKVIWRHRF
jgi:nitroimidazol reductase NimA-like FMN-containing flavoprotein (pyridoxamine 5'-phosphate oxidase superfamily)